MNRVVPVVAIMLTIGAGGVAGQAQSQPAPPAPQPAAARPESVQARPVRLQVVLSRFNGDKRVAHQPYGLSTVANGRPKILRIGAEVPIASGAAPTKDSPSPSYKSVGTNIVAEVTANEDGRYLVSVVAESSSPYP